MSGLGMAVIRDSTSRGYNHRVGVSDGTFASYAGVPYRLRAQDIEHSTLYALPEWYLI